ncbi:MAG TPA: hypothetical protein VGF84_07885, partial [Micromonosporaceae bacterium]
MTEPNIITSTLEAYADHATPVRADMLEVVERRFGRRRRNRAAASVAAAVVVVAVIVGGIAFNPFSGTADRRRLPTPPLVSSTVVPGTNWHIPTTGKLPSVTAQWPNAVAEVPTKAPDGGKTW